MAESTKVTCHSCKRFIGFLQPDGTGPILDCDSKGCPLAKPLAKYQPREIPVRLGLGAGRELPIPREPANPFTAAYEPED